MTNPNSEGFDPLDDLFLDHAEPVDKAQVAQILRPYVRLLADTKEVVPNTSWEDLNLQLKILVYMVGLKALKLRGALTETDEKLTPSDIEQMTGLKGNSIRPTLSKLVDSRLIRIDKESNRYFLPDFSVSRIAKLMSKEGET